MHRQLLQYVGSLCPVDPSDRVSRSSRHRRSRRGRGAVLPGAVLVLAMLLAACAPAAAPPAPTAAPVKPAEAKPAAPTAAQPAAPAAAAAPTAAPKPTEAPAKPTEPAKPAAAPSTVQDKLAAANKMPAGDRQKFMEDEAAKEGKVVWYVATEPGILAAWNERFRARYPKIDAQFVRMTTPEVLQRSISESQAGRPAADLLYTTAPELIVLEKASILARYDSPEAKDFNPEFKHAGGLWTAIQNEPQVVAFNTDLMKKEQIPTTLEGLTDPALKGKLGRHANGDRWVAAVLKAKGEAAGMDLINKVAAQEPRVYDSNLALANALGSGQVAVGFDIFLPNALKLMSDGAPADYVVPDPLFVTPVYIAMPKDAPHPYSAALLYDWLLSKDGQQLFVELYRQGPRSDLQYPNGEIIKNAKVLISHSPELLADRDRYNKIFTDLFVRR